MLRGAFADYITRMSKIQKSTHCLTGESLASVRDSLFVEVPKKKGFETLLLFELKKKVAEDKADKSVRDLTCSSRLPISPPTCSSTSQQALPPTISLGLDIDEDELIPEAPSVTRLPLANTLQVMITP